MSKKTISSYRVQSFDQGSDLDPVNRPASAQGACHNYSTKWLSMILKNRALGTADRIQKLRAAAREVQSINRTWGSTWDNEGSTAANQTAKFYGLEVKGTLRKSSIDGIGAFAKKYDDCGYIYTFSWANGSAHSIGLYRTASSVGCFGQRTGGYIYVFEPNFGEYRMGKSQLPSWLKMLEKQYHGLGLGKFKSHTLRWVEPKTAVAVKNGIKVM